MQMSNFPSRLLSALTCALCFVLASGLSACASKNPLMTEPTAKPAPESVAANITDGQKAIVAPIAATPPATDVAANKVSAPPPASGPDLNVQAPTGAKRWLGIFSPYKLDIQQGNFISQEMAAKIKEGLTKEQVRFILGVPLLTDMFHDGRWDYLFRLQKANGQVTNNRMTIYFKDNRVSRFESTNLPGEVEYISHISGTPAQPNVEKTQVKPEVTPEVKTETKQP